MVIKSTYICHINGFSHCSHKVLVEIILYGNENVNLYYLKLLYH